ncbi:MAG: lectin like domain-containing protein [Eubacteriales bacterium]|nr:lectin like domain-containing protein [Eubacteriales bacterium]
MTRARRCVLAAATAAAAAVSAVPAAEAVSVTAAVTAASLVLDGCSGEYRLPSSYDAREAGRTAPVKDQGDLGTCWAFASLLALESSLLPEEVWDFSEDHMSHNPDFNLEQKDGGDYIMSMAYLLSWRGPVTEEEDPYGDGISPQNLTAAKHVQEIRLLPSRDREEIKRAVYEVGGVQSALYTTFSELDMQPEYYNEQTGAYCCQEDRAPNHDVVIVGWDDDYPGENFAVEVPGDGAFLCENSWGTQFGQDGYFYVSYYDANLGKTSILYSRTEDPDNYDRIYQSDLCGWLGQIGYGGDTVWAVNVYQAGIEPERLDAVGFYATDQDTDYEVYVLRNVPDAPISAEEGFPLRSRAAKGHVDFAGYYTVSLEDQPVLEPGERFGIMIKIRTPDVIHPMAIEYDAGDGRCRVELADGEGYISPDGAQWERAEQTQDCNLCLKAYTTCLLQGKDTEQG